MRGADNIKITKQKGKPKMKRPIYTLIIAAIAITAFAFAALTNNAQAASKGTYNNLTYEIVNSKAVITGYTKEPSGDLIIPEKIEGYKVTEIKADAFNGCLKIKSVSMPSVEYIGTGAFEFCENITKLETPNVLTVYDYAFYGCGSLTEINLPKATMIGESAFGGWEEYPMNIKSISMPCAVSIGKYAFEFCSSLKSINLPDATTISTCAFSGCYSLTTLTLPKIRTIEEGAFYMCFDLNQVEIPDVYVIEDGAFYSCNIQRLDLYKVKKIGDYAFEENENLHAAYFYCDAPTEFGDGVFHYCAGDFTIYYAKGTKGWTTPVWNEYPTKEFEHLSGLGDLNGDNKVNTADAVVVLKASAGMITLDEQQTKSGDCNGDGTVNTADAVLILKYAAGMIYQF